MVVNSILDSGKGLIRLNLKGLDGDDQPVDTTMQGTVDQARELIAALEAQVANAEAQASGA